MGFKPRHSSHTKREDLEVLGKERERTMRLWWRRERGQAVLGKKVGRTTLLWQSGDPVAATQLMVPGA